MSRQRRLRGIGARTTSRLARAAMETLERRQMLTVTTAVAYDDFDTYAAGPLGGQGVTAHGFSGQWTLQSGATSPNYTVKGDDPGDVLVDPFKGYAGGSTQHFVSDANVYSIGRSL